MEDGIININYSQQYTLTKKKTLRNSFTVHKPDSYDYLIGKFLVYNNNIIQIKNIIYNDLYKIDDSCEYPYKIIMSNGDCHSFKNFQEIIKIYGNILNI
uniref:Uncharacterized protein n=1 Tax=viral metagenome TaxID=1070528 RepID=A0A6C0EUW3_9ZZZZ